MELFTGIHDLRKLSIIGLLLTFQKAFAITLASIIHNTLGTHSKEFYTPDGSINNKDDSENVAEGLWRDSSVINFIQSLAKDKSNLAKVSAEQVREIFAEYFLPDNSAPWQWNMIQFK